MGIEQALTLINAERPDEHRMARVFLESWLRSGKCPFGVYIRQPGKERGAYAIFPARLEVYLSGADMKNTAS